MTDYSNPGDPTPEATTFDVSELFPGINRPLSGTAQNPGPSTLDLWRQQMADEAEERRRLIAIVEAKQEREAQSSGGGWVIGGGCE